MIINNNSTRVELAGLSIIRNLLEDFNRFNIRYCHWKSNEHVFAAIMGDTDLDILFEPEEKEKVIDLLKSAGFRLFIAPKWKRYPDIEDYIGIDPESGKIVHVHAHFGLVLGEKWVKSYRLPWGKEILDKRIFDEEHNIYTSTPEFEFFLLIIRFAIKCKNNKKWADSEYPEVVNYLREARWLEKRVEQNRLLDLFNSKFEDTVTNTVEKIYQSGFDQNLFLTLNKLINNQLKQFRRFSTFNSNCVQYYRKSRYYSFRILMKLGIVDLIPKRSLPNKGLIISIMGADGSGKSTQTARVFKELNKKVDVKYVYLGSGQGSRSLQRTVLKGLIKGFRILSKPNRINGNNLTVQPGNNLKSNKKTSFIKESLNIIMALSVAREKRVKLNRIKKAKNNGVIIVCDRYPQIEIHGYNDGPKLSQYLNHNWLVLRKVASYEYSIYKMSQYIYPDLVLKLVADPKILFNRRPEMSFEMIDKKQKGILDISMTSQTEIAEIDASLSIEGVTKKLLHKIGDKLIKN